MTVEFAFDFRSETPAGRDADEVGPTLSITTKPSGHARSAVS